MKIGFYMKWPRGISGTQGVNVIGDELYGESMCQTLSGMDGVEQAGLFAPNLLPREKLDVMVYLNDVEPRKELARRHVLYMQNAYGAGSDITLKKLQKMGFDGFAFISHKLLDMHRQDGYDGIYLPFGVNTALFNPRPVTEKCRFDVAYIGNDIKGEFRTKLFLLPAARYNFGLYGNWGLPVRTVRDRLKFWKKDRIPEYRQVFSRIYRGKIPQEKVPYLYSSARINLNCTIQDCVDWDVITLRTYEVLACKGFLITDRVAIAEKTMEGCQVFTDGGQDLVDKIDYYLAHEEERERISQKGYEFVLKNATIGARMKELADYLRVVL